MLKYYSVISLLILNLITILNISFLLKCDIKKRLLLFLITTVLLSIILHLKLPFKTIIQLIILTTIFYFIKKDLKKSLGAIFLSYFILLISEIFITSLILLIKNTYEITSLLASSINIVIGIISFLLIRTKSISKLWKVIENKLERYIPIFLFIILLLIYINIGYSNNIINISIIIFCLIIIIYNLIKKIIENNIMETKIDEMLKYIKRYEEQIDILRVNQHENKNTLLCIKALAANNENKKIVDYIDDIFNNELSQDYGIISDLQIVRISAVRGLLYYKLSLCKENKINYVLNVSKSIHYDKIDKLPIGINKDLTMILGTLLDNAIEACLETEQKSLSIYIYEEDNKIVFQISNTFKGMIDINLLYKKGYSTKGKNRGYGLELVKKKVDRNKKLSIKSEIKNDIFIQYLKLELN